MMAFPLHQRGGSTAWTRQEERVKSLAFDLLGSRLLMVVVSREKSLGGD
jgi:hypothetical protein